MILQIKDFNGYFVDNLGNIYTTKKNGGYPTEMTLLKKRIDKDGYFEVGLYKNKKRFFRRVHRLVAEAFIPNDNHYPQINHKDGNKQNNIVSNLEWCTCSDNMLHSFHVLHRQATISVYKPVKLTNKVTKQVLFFNTIKDCAFYLHMSFEHLSKLLNGKKNIEKWRKGKMYEITYYNTEGVTTSCNNVENDEISSRNVTPSHER